ncbi:unnamed protein product [Phytomonas sp. EM1]|nr:unnamed protein product [Phytomonas sp. EM1]|eukprot:CCW64435.1 unnamed protein product [Phytomonas sp. isolate EM1]
MENGSVLGTNVHPSIPLCGPGGLHRVFDRPSVGLSRRSSSGSSRPSRLNGASPSPFPGERPHDEVEEVGDLTRSDALAAGEPITKVLLVSDPIFDSGARGSVYALTCAASSQNGSPTSAPSSFLSSSFASTRSGGLRVVGNDPDENGGGPRRVGNAREEGDGGGSTSAPLSRCRRKLLSLRQPAFDLGAIEGGRSAPLAGDDEVCSAAKCHPVSKITDFLYIGTWRDAADAGMLRARNIKYLLNVAKELEPGNGNGNGSGKGVVRSGAVDGVECHSIAMMDCQHQDLNSCLDDAFAFMKKARTEKGRVLVYCRRGISRSAAIVIAYLMAMEGMSYQDAFELVRECRSCVSLNLAFHEKLLEFQEETEWYRRQRECCTWTPRSKTLSRTDSEGQEGISLSSTTSLDLKACEEHDESEVNKRDNDREFSFLKLCVER